MTSTRPAHSSHNSHGPPAANGTSTRDQLMQKSHVVAGVQDAYWSDDEDEESECPLCVGQMDMDDLNFKPCPCGYQICRFCYHHIKENLNGRCPACRRPYDDESVEYKAMSPEDQKRLTHQKKQKEKEKRELEALKRAHLPNMRVVQRNVVYVTGLGPRFAKEELIPSLRSNDYFGQYGKITKILLVKRSATATREATTGVYITYNRREDAARAIAGVDGSPSPGGGGEVMRASYGTTKYCMNFLRNITCTNPGCMELHDWGDEKDSFTKGDLATLKHALKDSENRQRFSSTKEADSLPRTASWGSKAPTLGSISPKIANASAISSGGRAGRSTRSRPGTAPSNRATTSAAAESSRAARTVEREREKDRERRGHTHSSSSSSATPSTGAPGLPLRAKSPPSRPITPATSLPPRPPTSTDSRAASATPSATSSPVSVVRTIPTSESVMSPSMSQSVELPKKKTPPPISVTPAPPAASSQNTYQPSSQIQALLDDARARRESNTVAQQSPFPDLDRTLAALNDSGFSFSFNLDPSLIAKQPNPSTTQSARPPPPGLKPSFDPFASTTTVPLPATPQATSSNGQAPLPPPPGLARFGSTSQTLPSTSSATSRDSGYNGNFDPFTDPSIARPNSLSPTHGLEDESTRRGSRFGFAQKVSSDGGSRFSGSAAASPLSGTGLLPNTSLYPGSDIHSPAPSLSPQLPQWTYNSQQEYSLGQGLSSLHLNANAIRAPGLSPSFSAASAFSPFGNTSEASLKDMLNIGRAQPAVRRDMPGQGFASQPFNDPAIMSMRMSESPRGDSVLHQANQRHHTAMDGGHAISPFGMPPGMLPMPPPGLQRLPTDHKMTNGHAYQPAQTVASQYLSERDTSPYPTRPTISTAVFPSPTPSSAAPVPETASPAITSAVTTQSPTFSPADFPVLSVAPKRRDHTPKKSESKAAKRPSISSTPSIAPMTPVVNVNKPQPKKSSSGFASISKVEPAPSTMSSPSTSFSQLRDELEELKVAGKDDPMKSPVPLPSGPVLSRKQKRMQARVTKEKAVAPSVTSASTAPSRVPSPPATASPVTTPAHLLAGPAVEDDPQADGLFTSASDPEILDSNAFSTTAASSQPSPHSSGTGIASPPPASGTPLTEAAVLETASPSIPTPELSESVQDLATESSVAPATPSEPVLSRKARKLLAAKAARELAEARSQAQLQAQHRASATEISQSSSTDAIYNNLRSARDLLLELRESMAEETSVFLDPQAIKPKWSIPLPYAPLVDALSVLSIGNTAFTDNMPSSGSAISSFQQLLETLTQAISDLLRLLPRITWSDSSAFDSAILDILKAEDFMTDGVDDPVDQDGDVAALTQALERRAKWMKVQLAKLEELHRDINSAAVRAIMGLNDRGWDPRGILPTTSGSLDQFEKLGTTQDPYGDWRPMTADELEIALSNARAEEADAEVELKRVMRLNMEL